MNESQSQGITPPNSDDKAASSDTRQAESTAADARVASDQGVVGVPPEFPALSARSRQLMSRDTAAVLVIDVQEKLVPHIQGSGSILWNIRRLIDGASVLNVSTLCTEQYPKGLGTTVPMLADRVQVDDEKLLFSCRDCENVIERLRSEKRHQVLLCGIESHVCVQQTAFDLLAQGFDVWIAVDAVGSRYSLDHETALRRMQAAGVSLTTTESALFEWCEVSGTHEFKRISSLVRELPPTNADLVDARYFPRAPARYIVQSDHRESTESPTEVKVDLHFLVRDTATGRLVREYQGSLIRDPSNPQAVRQKQGTQACEVTADGTAVSVQDADESIQTVYLPIGDARTNHPRWKVRRTERHIASEEYKTDYEITIAVVDYKTDDTFRQYTGYEHRLPDGSGYSHVSGVRQVEVSSDGCWMVVTEMGRPPELIELPLEN